MSGILQQGYSFGYVIAACANLGVGGSVESWKIVFWIGAGISIAVGLIRICFPESRQFLEAKEKGKTGKAQSVFWQETRHMLKQEWRMCVYCVILMTWVSFSHTVLMRTALTSIVQLLFAHQPGQLHDIHAHSKRSHKRPRDSCLHSHEDRRMCRWHNHRLPIPMVRASSYHRRRSPHVRRPDPRVDSSRRRARSLCIRILHAILCPRSLVSDKALTCKCNGY